MRQSRATLPCRCGAVDTPHARGLAHALRARAAIAVLAISVTAIIVITATSTSTHSGLRTAPP